MALPLAILSAMATQTALSVEEYLETPYDGREPEYVHGEIVERGMPDPEHWETVQAFSIAFGPLHKVGRLRAGPELRVQVAPEKVRIPDFSVYRERPKGKLPNNPPLLVVEVVSPDDRRPKLLEKLKEYHSWGAEHIWVADPHSRELSVYDEGGWHGVERFELPEFGIALTADELFS